MFDLKTAKSIRLSSACDSGIADYVGHPISPQTAARWVRRGLVAADGVRVFLRAAKIGRALFTTDEAIDEFFAELTRRTGKMNADDDSELSDARTAAQLKAAGLVSAN